MTADQMAATHAAAFTQSRPWSRDEFASLLADPACHAFGDARAFAVVRLVLDEVELLTLATHPDHQRQGLARQVMQSWHAALVEHGATRAFLEVAADNIPAQALYQAQGYAIQGRRKGYYRRQDGPSVDALIMARALS